jgi:hypothetical protein
LVGIRVEVEIQGAFESVRVDALVDTGASSNFLRRELNSGKEVDDVGPNVVERKRTVTLPNGAPVSVDPVSFPSMKLYRRNLEPASFLLMGDLKEEAIIGYRTMRDLDLLLRPRIDQAWPSKER